MPADQITVALIDSHPAIREALSAQLEETMGLEVGGSYESARACFKAFEETLPDVLVSELLLPDTHGLDLIERVRNRYTGVEIVIFSRCPEKIFAERSIRKGARAYLMKTEHPDRVLTAIRSAHSGEVHLSNQMAASVINHLSNSDNGQPGFPIDNLTDRELSVFQMIGHGLTVPEITERLSLSRKTVETYRRRAKEKLELQSTNELLQFALSWTQTKGQRQREAR